MTAWYAGQEGTRCTVNKILKKNNFGFSPVIWILSIAPICVSNHTILENAFIFLFGCWYFGHKLRPKYFEGELSETKFLKIYLLVWTLSLAFCINIKLAITYRSRIPCLHTSDLKRKYYSQRTILLPVKSVYENWFLVMRKENEKGVRRKGTEGNVYK